MNARTVTVDLNPEMWEEALNFGKSVKEQIAGFAGLKSWVLIADRETDPSGERSATRFSVRAPLSIDAA